MRTQWLATSSFSDVSWRACTAPQPAPQHEALLGEAQLQAPLRSKSVECLLESSSLQGRTPARRPGGGSSCRQKIRGERVWGWLPRLRAVLLLRQPTTRSLPGRRDALRVGAFRKDALPRRRVAVTAHCRCRDGRRARPRPQAPLSCRKDCVAGKARCRCLDGRCAPWVPSTSFFLALCPPPQLPVLLPSPLHADSVPLRAQQVKSTSLRATHWHGSPYTQGLLLSNAALRVKPLTRRRVCLAASRANPPVCSASRRSARLSLIILVSSFSIYYTPASAMHRPLFCLSSCDSMLCFRHKIIRSWGLGAQAWSQTPSRGSCRACLPLPVPAQKPAARHAAPVL